METTPVELAVWDALIGGVQNFLSIVDWLFMATLIMCVFLSNLILPRKAEIPLAIRWIAQHRYRVPFIAFCLSLVFMSLRDYDAINRELIFRYFATLLFSMTFNLWLLDHAAKAVSERWPWLAPFLRGADKIPQTED